MHVRRLMFIPIVALSVLSAQAQHNPYEYYISGNSSQFTESAGSETDLALFYAPLEGGSDIFTQMSEFNFSAVRYSRRGFDMPMKRIYLGGVELSGSLTGRHDYSAMSGLRRLRLPRENAAGSGLSGSSAGLADGVETFLPDTRLMPRGGRGGLAFDTRSGSGVGNFWFAGEKRPKYTAVASATLKSGRNGSMHDMYSEEVSAAILNRFEFNKYHSIFAGASGGKSERDVRSSATKEAFVLTGDNYYDPSWGYDGDRKYHSRVRTDKPLLIFAGYEGRFSANTKADATISYRAGENAYSALAWFDAETPYPDYYRYMPGWFGDTPIGDLLREKWRAEDPGVTQIDLLRMCEANRYGGQIPVEQGGSRYFIEDRVERTNDMQAAVSLSTRLSDRSSANYGVRLRGDDVRYFKRVKDMLGGAEFINADQYLADTVRYGGKWLNDVRNPGRLVGKGDKFGYDYHLQMRKTELFGSYHYADNSFRLDAAAELGAVSIGRTGNYEKQLHPGSASYGDSKKIEFDTYTAKLSAGYSFSPRHIVRVTGLAAEIVPAAAGMFVSPQAANMTIDYPRTVAILSAEAEYTMTLNSFKGKIAGYYTATSHESAVYSYYDDIESIYSDMVLSDISKRFFGVEFGAQYDFSPRLSLSVAASAGKYEYSSDPSVKIYDDATLKPYVEDAYTYLTGYHVGNTPEVAASAELKYNVYGFITSLTVSYMGRRYVTPNPLRRMERAYMQVGSREGFLEFVAQEKLPGAMTAGLFVMKSFDIGNGGLTLLASVDNLLNKQDVIYSGYEQMRIMQLGGGLNHSYTPLDSKYLYACPRTVYLSATYRF